MSLSHAPYNECAGARREWTKYLAQKTAPVLCQQIDQLFKESQELAEKVGREEQKQIDVGRVFEMALEDVPLWNSDIIRQKTQEVESKVPNLKAMLKATAVAYIYVMSSVRLGVPPKEDPLALVVPSPESFVHKLFVLSVEELEPSMFPLTGRAKREVCRRVVAKNVPVALRELISPDEVLNDYFTIIEHKKEYGSPPPERSKPTEPERSRSRSRPPPPAETESNSKTKQ